VPDVLSVAAFQIGDPVSFVVAMESDDFSCYAWPRLTIRMHLAE